MRNRIERYQLLIEDYHWWYQGKKNLIQRLFQMKFQDSYPNDKLNILEIGCSTGKNLFLLPGENTNRIGIDISKIAIEMGKHIISKNDLKNVELLHMDIFDSQLPNDFFDLILFFDVLEHLKDENVALIKINRLLRQNGLLFITVPAFNSLWSFHDILLQHNKRYSKKYLHNILIKNGYVIHYIGYWNFFLFFLTYIKKMQISKTKNVTDLLSIPSRMINIIFLKLLNIENSLISKNIKFPFGVTLVCIAQKTKHS